MWRFQSEKKTEKTDRRFDESGQGFLTMPESASMQDKTQKEYFFRLLHIMEKMRVSYQPLVRNKNRGMTNSRDKMKNVVDTKTNDFFLSLASQREHSRETCIEK